MRDIARGAVVVLVLAQAAVATPEGYGTLLGWSDLPGCKVGITAGLASSYDRAGGNNDYNYYLQPEGLQTQDLVTVIADLQGPGVITRFWMPHATANAVFPVRIFVDGILRVDTDSNTLLDGRCGYMTSPLVQTLVGGQVSYEPIAFQQSLRIESSNFAGGGWARTHHYYQYSYQKLPADQVVTPCTGALTVGQQQARSAVVAMLANVGSNPAGPSGTSRIVPTAPATVPASAALTLADLSGGGTIRRLSLKLPPGLADAQLDGLRLRIRFDGQAAYAVDVPVAHFFGAGHGRVAYRSLPLGTDSPDGFYCYWPMPYRQGAAVELFNAGSAAVSVDAAAVEYEPVAPPEDAGYLHAVYSEQITTANQGHHVLLQVPGQGHYIGNLLYVEKAGDSRSILEGDDIVTVNPGAAGEATLYGTGLEDAYNGGYYYNHVVVQTNDGDVASPVSGTGPYSGLLYMDFFDLPGFLRTRTDQYRWLIADCVPFTDGITVKIENYGNQGGVRFGSTAFYYAVPPLTADCNGDRRVDLYDLLTVVHAYGASLGSPRYDAQADLNGSNRVDVMDLLAIANSFGAAR